MVEEDVRGMNCVGSVGGRGVVGVGALVFAYLAWGVSRKQLRLAREQATLRPKR